MNKWISINDEKPIKGKIVLAYGIDRNNEEFYTTCEYDFEGDFISDHFCEIYRICNITHWMALPAPPHKEQS